jgi:hypothetical protein
VGNNDPDILVGVSSQKIPPNGSESRSLSQSKLDALLDQARINGPEKRKALLWNSEDRGGGRPYNLWYPDNVCVHREADEYRDSACG